MKTYSINIKLNHIIILAIITSLVLLYAFRGTNENLENEYMSISIEINNNHQLLYLSKTGDNVKKIAFVNPDMQRLKNKILEDGFEVKEKQKEKQIESIYDYRPIFDLILELEKEGWELKSHSFGIAYADEISTTRISQYLLSRQKKQ